MYKTRGSNPAEARLPSRLLYNGHRVSFPAGKATGAWRWPPNPSSACSVSQLVDTLRYKLEGCGFDVWWCHWKFFINLTLPAPLCPCDQLSLWQKWVPGLSPRGKGGRYLGLNKLPPSCTDCLKFLRVLLSWSPKGLSRDIFTCTLYSDNYNTKGSQSGCVEYM